MNDIFVELLHVTTVACRFSALPCLFGFSYFQAEMVSLGLNRGSLDLMFKLKDGFEGDV
jgi:hypothetical protein